MARCRECGYDLSGLRGGVCPVICPECGLAVLAADAQPRAPEATWAELGRWRWVMEFVPGGVMLAAWTLAWLDIPWGWNVPLLWLALGLPAAAWIASVFAASLVARGRSLTKVERVNFVCMAAARSLVFVLCGWVLAVVLVGVLGSLI